RGARRRRGRGRARGARAGPGIRGRGGEVVMRRRGEMVDTGAVRNLDEIQEDDPGARPSRAGALVLASLGGACIVFAAVALLRAPARERPTSADPLGELVARAHPAGVKID